MRKLASIQKILDIQPIDGADRIEQVTVNGWTVVAQKGLYKIGDLAVYFEIDSFLPEEEKYEFLRKSCFKQTKNLGNGFRIRTMKLRKVVSQGMLMPLSELFTGELDALLEGDDVTELLNVQKWEMPIPAQLAGVMKGNFPIFIPKTDQERIQNIINKTKRYDNPERIVDGNYEVSLKLDGSSMTVYSYQGEVGVCSRNLDLKLGDENQGNSFVRTAISERLLEKLQKLSQDTGEDFAFQGELMGEGIQGNREKLKGLSFYLFDIYNITQGRYLLPTERQHLANTYEIQHVPVMSTYCDVSLDWLLKDFLSLADTESITNNIAEGLVFKSNEVIDFSFKVINNKFLLKCED